MLRARERLASGLCLGAILFISGCATHSQRFAAVEEQIASGDLVAALQTLEKDRSGNSRDEVLYQLNRALLLRMQGEYSQSNVALEKAKGLIEELDAVSVSEQAASLTINDTLQSFMGADYERSLLHAFMALNFIQQGNLAAARVEALQLDVVLKLQADDGGGSYTEDAFVRYLSGIIFENLGEWSDAMIAYRKAYHNYRESRSSRGVAPPHSLGLALIRMAEHLGLKDELSEYRKAFAIERWASLQDVQAAGEVLIFVNTGLAPVKRSQSVSIYAPEVGVMLSIATPRYETRPQWVGKVQVQTGDELGSAELVEDIDVSAKEALEARMSAITARALARAVVKYQATRQAQEKNNGLGLLVNIVGVLTEQADTRSWFTLPQRIYLARQYLTPGPHDVSVQILADDGRVLAEKAFSGIEVEAGRKVYLTWDWIPAAITPSRRH